MVNQNPTQKTQGSGIQSSFYNESSTFLRSKHLPRPHTQIFFNFILASPLNEVRAFFITVIKKKYPNVFYAYDSSSFCLLKCNRNLKKGQRYVVYGKLTKNRLYFLESLKEEEVDYKELCYMLL
ncbi:uncharacterized protein VICG_01972 [Vittaforma corneae ATCC 50505]|uniref:Uncharacterized protein n=1 Tax=Vittaforma corneae (strain ATCC 50505) TaxID=993615 RepID=L2GJF9_VITCO|nr:uncharacterized protein VICG_01972 [Vittaforma corneae ATCC 50505]ELA41013.1 hypothetical protein VICG_01972 [Vittaforma corneae ATCC 50505]